jgi:very-short-patch-repair endonuclease
LEWKGYHALNGGEYHIKELGYWMDYYEPSINLVIEYDELHHTRRTEKDARRQREIEDYLQCRFGRINENTPFEDVIKLLSMDRS